MVRRLSADDVGRLKALGAFQQIKLYGLTLIQGAVAVLLDCGKVYEHIFPRRALDKSISFRPVEPLYCTFLSHGKYSFHQSRRIVPQILGLRLDRPKPPSKKPVELSVASPMCRGNYFQKGKDSSVPGRDQHPLWELLESDNLARFHHTQQTSTTYWSHHRTVSR
jgi:hypothetical protein